MVVLGGAPKSLPVQSFNALITLILTYCLQSCPLIPYLFDPVLKVFSHPSSMDLPNVSVCLVCDFSIVVTCPSIQLPALLDSLPIRSCIEGF